VFSADPCFLRRSSGLEALLERGRGGVRAAGGCAAADGRRALAPLHGRAEADAGELLARARELLVLGPRRGQARARAPRPAAASPRRTRRTGSP
jgi:hypothetical protein